MNLQRGLIAAVAVAALALAAGLPACADPPPAPWLTEDIGSPPKAGSTTVDANGVWTITGSGGIWGDTDQFQFAYQPFHGDASLTARFLSMQGGDSRVGLIVRTDDTPSAPNLFYFMSNGLGKGLSGSTRGAPQGDTGCLCEVGPSRQREPNLLMRLQRAGNEFAGFYSRDGNLWFQADFGPMTLPNLQEQALWGLAASSFNPLSFNDSLATGMFDHVDLQPDARSVYGIRGCGGNQAVLLQWRPLKDAVAYNVYRGPGGAAPNPLEKLNADRVTGTSFTDNSTGLVNGTPLTYAVAALFTGADGSPVEGPRVAIPATPVAAPPGWLGCSLDEGPSTGSADYDAAAGKITLRGSGLTYARDFDVWMNNSEGYLLSQLVEGDVQITVKALSGPTQTAAFAKAGLFICESLDGGARSMFLGPTAAGGLLARWRLTANGFDDGATALEKAALKLPITLRLTRRGDTITAEYSVDDGKSFQRVDEYAYGPPLPKMLYIGLIITSDDRTKISEATFSVPQIQKL
jgi:hypothetical protein